jgi:Tfp pilus assembly protein PilN
MRPVDLTPEEERGRRGGGGGDRAPSRAGNLSFVLVGALALLVICVAALALTSKSISDKEADVAQLEQDLASAEAKATALQPFATFRSIQESRASTVASLAQSRFDWERVMRELSLVLPDDVWLTNLTGTVLPEVTVPNEAAISVRDSILGPALELIGCAPSQDSVAGLVAALEDIDGVTRVGVSSSELPDAESVDAADQPAGGDQEECRTRSFISRFEIVLAFDAVPAPAGATAPPPSVPAPLPSGDEPQLADTTAQASSAEQTADAQNATETLIPGG